MDHAAYHVVYVDNRANNDLDGKYLQRRRPGSPDGSELGRKESWEYRGSEYVELILMQIEEVRDNIKSILSNFNGGTFVSALRGLAKAPGTTRYCCLFVKLTWRM